MKQMDRVSILSHASNIKTLESGTLYPKQQQEQLLSLVSQRMWNNSRKRSYKLPLNPTQPYSTPFFMPPREREREKCIQRWIINCQLAHVRDTFSRPAKNGRKKRKNYSFSPALRIQSSFFIYLKCVCVCMNVCMPSPCWKIYEAPIHSLFLSLAPTFLCSLPFEMISGQKKVDLPTLFTPR